MDATLGVDQRVAAIVEQLRADGHRLTPQRLAIVRHLVCDDSHPTIDDVYQRVRTEYPMVSLATIYNSVQTLKEMGVVLELPSARGNRYDGVHPEPHPHLVCVRCGRVEDLPAPAVMEVLQRAIPGSGYSEATPHVEIRGLCPDCAAQQRQNADAS